MENAVKALIMVAALIIGVLIIGLLVYLFRIGGNVASNYDQSMSEGEISSFNAKFEAYMTNMIINTNTQTSSYNNVFIQHSNTINDVVSVINLAYDINAQLKSNNDSDGIAVEVKVGSESYYMKASLLYDYFEQTLNTANKKRDKNIAFKVSTPPASHNYDTNNIIKLNELITKSYQNNAHNEYQLNDTVLYNNGRYEERIYRFYFDCKPSDVEYSSRGRINKMVFELVDTLKAFENASFEDEAALNKIKELLQ